MHLQKSLVILENISLRSFSNFLIQNCLFLIGSFLRNSENYQVILFINQFPLFGPLREANCLCNYYQSKNVHFFLEFLRVTLGGYLKVEISGYHTKITRDEFFLTLAKLIPFFLLTRHNSTCLSLEKKMYNQWPYLVTTENYVYLQYVYYVNCICRSLEILEDIICVLRNFL